MTKTKMFQFQVFPATIRPSASGQRAGRGRRCTSHTPTSSDRPWSTVPFPWDGTPVCSSKFCRLHLLGWLCHPTLPPCLSLQSRRQFLRTGPVSINKIALVPYSWTVCGRVLSFYYWYALCAYAPVRKLYSGCAKVFSQKKYFDLKIQFQL